jgi:Nucleotidyl transferase AbiEii toxin, Type IV TA system
MRGGRLVTFDFAAPAIENTIEKVLSAVQIIAAISIEDGMEFDSNGATAETVREDDSYSGIRVTLGGTLSRAVIRFHVDVNVGDPIWPAPEPITVPRLIDGVIVVRGYALEMVLAEKIVTALERGTANTRWRDFVDIYVLTGRYAINGQTLKSSMQRVAQFRDAGLVSLRTVLDGYAAIAQSRWRAWLQKQRSTARFRRISRLFLSRLGFVALLPVASPRSAVGDTRASRKCCATERSRCPKIQRLMSA